MENGKRNQRKTFINVIKSSYFLISKYTNQYSFPKFVSKYYCTMYHVVMTTDDREQAKPARIKYTIQHNALYFVKRKSYSFLCK